MFTPPRRKTEEAAPRAAEGPARPCLVLQTPVLARRGALEQGRACCLAKLRTAALLHSSLTSCQ